MAYPYQNWGHPPAWGHQVHHGSYQQPIPNTYAPAGSPVHHYPQQAYPQQQYYAQGQTAAYNTNAWHAHKHHSSPQQWQAPMQQQWQQQEAKFGFIPNMLDHTAFATMNQRLYYQQQGYRQQQQQQQQVPPRQDPWQFGVLGRTDPIDKFYSFGKQLGKGAFSIVYLAIEYASGKEYAVKAITKKPQDRNAMSMVVTEIQVFRALGNHNHVVTLKDVFETATTYYLVLEKITGGEVFERIVELKHFSEQQASRLVHEMLLGLETLWNKNIVHRDLKPENLLLSNKEENARLLITDFGLSQILKQPNEPMNVPVGTPAYLAPELIYCIESGRPYGRECDMWSVGVIIYVMVCGFAPFYGRDNNEMFSKIKAGYYGFPSPYWDNISEEAKDLIRGCLQVNPQHRLTPQQALNHKWIIDWKALRDVHLTATLQNLETFNKRKFRGAIQKVLALNRFKKAAGALNALGKEQQQNQDAAQQQLTEQHQQGQSG